MNKPWKVILAFTGVFLAGAILGGVITLRMAREFGSKRVMMDHFAPMIMKRYAEKLDLSEEQAAKVKAIVQKTEEHLRQLRTQGFRDVVDVAEKMNAEVANLLTPEQRVRLDELKQEMRERWKQERTRRNMRPDRPFGDREPRDMPPPDMPPPPPDGAS